MFGPPDYSHPDSFLRPRLGPWAVTLYLHRRPLLDALLAAAPSLTGELLDVGCGNRPYASLLTPARYVGLDVATSPHDHARFDATFDGLSIPFPDASFDSVLCTEVLEHAREPRHLAGEIGRVLRPGGHALLTVPFVLNHHEQPHDYHRFTRFGIEELVRSAGLEPVWVRPRGGVFAVLAQQLEVAAAQVVSRRPVSDLLRWSLFPTVIGLLALDRWRPRSDIITLGWQVLARRAGS